MDEGIKSWIENTLVGQDFVAFSKLGEKRQILRVQDNAPLVSRYMDPATSAHVSWGCLPGLSATDSFFERLRPIITQHGKAWFYVSIPQGEYNVVRGVAPLNAAAWNSSRLFIFQNIGSEGGPQLLCFLLENRAIIAFSMDAGLEIAYYGGEDLWNEISVALNA